VLRGLPIEGPGRVSGSVRPVRRFHARRGLILRPPPRPKSRVGPPALARPFRDVSRKPRTHRPVGRRFRPGLGAHATSPGLSCPTTHTGRAGSLMWTVSPLTARDRIRGLATPLTALPHASSRRRSAGASLGFSLQGVPLGAMGPPLGAPALLTLPAARSSLRRSARHDRLQGLVPATSPCRRPAAEAVGPSMPSWDSPLQSVLPIRPGRRL
jgi:hypothetical protein